MPLSVVVSILRCICLLLFLPLVIGARNNKTITLNSSLTAGDGSESSWLSPSGDFAFGFQRVAAAGGFLLAIWYNKIPQKTVVWSANRDELAPQGSKLQLTKDGLKLTHPNGRTTWSKIGGSGNIYAVMLDTGNLVVADVKGGAKLWESFNEPTDTILPRQIMSRNTTLIARFSDTNYSSGRFKLAMQSDGNCVSYTINWPQQSEQYSPYYSASTYAKGYQVVFSQSGEVNVVDINGTYLASLSTYVVDPAKDLYQRAILEFDGVFRKYVYPKSGSANQPVNWTMHDFQPQDICQNMSGETGPGACGFNSLCRMGGDMRPKCGCPQGYSFVDEMDHQRGCKRGFVAQSCLDEPQEINRFQLVEMPATDFAGVDFEIFGGQSEDGCGRSCLVDCLCAAAVFLDKRCWKKRFPLSNGRVGAETRSKAFIKVGTGNSTLNPEPDKINQQTTQAGGDRYRVIVLVESVFLGASVFLLLALGVFAFTFRGHKKVEQHKDNIAGTNIRSFGYRELQEATSGFKEVIGQGAFATVYKGLEEGKLIAVKKLNEFVEESQREFEAEVKAIAKTGHRNLVQLLGFCNEERHRLLVYEYMPNGTLADILFKGHRISLCRRIRFGFEIARGLNYLHEECSTQIIHCDIKPQNVLLDESFTVRISDFGLAKLLKKDQTHTLTGIRGTKGYVAPEWFRSMPITTKVDVYSYGILLLEIICCRRCFVADMEDESRMVLADWAYDCYREGRVHELVEGDEEAMSDVDKVNKLVMVALCCIQDNPSHRPPMNKVIEMIKAALGESLPHDFASHIISISMNDLPPNSVSFIS